MNVGLDHKGDAYAHSAEEHGKVPNAPVDILGGAEQDNVADKAQNQGTTNMKAAFPEVIGRLAEGDEGNGTNQGRRNSELAGCQLFY